MRGRVVAEGRDDDGQRDERRAARSDQRRRGALGDSRDASHFIDRQRIKIRHVDQHIDRRQDQDAEEQCARKVALRVLDFAGGIGHEVPPFVSPEHGDHRDAESHLWTGETRRHDRLKDGVNASRDQRHHRQRREPAHFRDGREDVDHVAAANADVVDRTENAESSRQQRAGLPPNAGV